MQEQDIESAVLQTLAASDSIADSGPFCESIDVSDHNTLVGVLKSLEAYEMIELEVRESVSEPPQVCPLDG